MQNQLRIIISQNTCSWLLSCTKAIKFKGNQTISSFTGVCSTYCITKVQSMISYNNISLKLVREVSCPTDVIACDSSCKQDKWNENSSPNGTKSGSVDFILSAWKGQSRLIQKTQEGKRRLEGLTFMICAIVKEILKCLIHLQHLTLNSKR